MLLSSPKYILLPTLHRLSIYVYILYTVLFAYLSNNADIGNRYIELSLIPIYYMAYEKNKLFGRSRDNRILIILLTPFVFITNFTTLNAYRVNPYISRAAKKQYDYGVEHLKTGIGGYEFIYFLVFVFMILTFFIYKNNKIINKKQTTVLLIVLSVFAVTIIYSNYTLALLMLIMIIIIRLLFPRFNNIHYLFLWLVLLIVFVMFSNEIILFILKALQSVLGDTRNAAKILELKYYIETNYMDSSLFSRYSVYIYSIEAFIHHPIFGTLATSQENIFKNVARFGNHSQLLDTFAFYGLGIGVLQLYIYLKPIKSRIVKINGSFDSLPILLMLLLIILITLNVMTQSIGFAIYFISLTIDDWIKEKLGVSRNTLGDVYHRNMDWKDK